MRRLLLLLITLLPLMASAYDACINGIYYDFSGDEATVTYQYAELTDENHGYYTSNYSGRVVIPESVIYNGKTYRITCIGDYAFWCCNNLTSVQIPNSVTKIGKDAFRACSGLTSATIPNSVTSIGNGVFMNCTGLTTIILSNSITSIRSNSFSNCSSLTSISIPNSVTSIGKYARCQDSDSSHRYLQPHGTARTESTARYLYHRWQESICEVRNQIPTARNLILPLAQRGG